MKDLQPLQSPLSHIPAGIHCAWDYEILARHFIAAPVYAYISGGSAHDESLARNREAFAHWAICPRLLRDVSNADTRLHLPGGAFEHPILLAPVAFHALVHARGELEAARAAAAVSGGFIASTLSSHRLEDIAAVAGPSPWFQLYMQPRWESTLALVRRAEAAGFRAIVLTLDVPIQVPSFRAQAAGFRMPEHLIAANLTALPTQPLTNASRSIFQGLMRNAPGWKELDALLASTALPVWVKGVLHPDDALLLKDRGVAGLLVSNHGGRSLDGAPAALQMLPSIRQAVGASYPLLFDSGIRAGADVFKAIALGADAVLVGRLQLYALSVAGALGVAHMLRLLREELEICMAHSGCRSLAEVRNTALLPQRAALPALAEPPC